MKQIEPNRRQTDSRFVEGATVRILVLNGGSQDFVTVENAIRAGAVEIAAPTASGMGRRYAFAGRTLDVATREFRDADGCCVHLTSSEFDLLSAFLREPGRPLSRIALTHALKGRDWSYFDRSIDTLVGRLRKKLPGEPSLIRSVRGVGYVFCAVVRACED